MKPSDLYAMAPESVTHNFDGVLCGYYYNHIPELGQHWPSRLQSPMDFAKRVETRCIKWFWFDHRRFWRLATVWFDGEPVMVIRNAGREGDDWHDRFVTDADGYAAMVAYLLSLPRKREVGFAPELYDPEADIPKLDEFYNSRLHGHFERY